MIAAGRLTSAIRSGPLASRDFRLLSIGQVTSTVGDFCYAVALPWLILSGHGGPVLLGIVLACYGIPRTVLIPVGGMLADKLGPRKIMLVADLVRCALVAALAILAGTHIVTLVALGPVAAIIGAGEGLFIPASNAIMPTLLPAERLQAGNAINGAAVQLGSLAGPAIGGILVAFAGSAPAFAVDAATFAVSALTLALIRTRRTEPVAAEPDPAAPYTTEPYTTEPYTAAPGAAGPGAAELNAAELSASAAGEGPTGVWSLLKQARLLRVIVVVCVAANFAFGGAFEVALPALAHARFGATGYGALIACLGAGAVIGTLAAARGTTQRRPSIPAAVSFLLEGVAVALIPFLGGVAGAAAAAFVFGICNGFGNIILLTLIQRWAPPQLLGRVMSIVMLASMGSFPLSVALSGLLVRHLGATPFFPVAGAVLVIAVLGALTQREYRDLGAAVAPTPALGAELAH
jgi:MFS family permease